MGDTPGRMLQLLSLFQARRSWGGGELAERLEVTERTVRRDVERLRLLGYPVEAIPGRHGGYQLGRGGRLPPLLLNDDEAVAVAIGLRTAVDGSVAGLEEPAMSTLAKLDQLLPAHVAHRVRSLHDSTASLQRSWRPPPSGNEGESRVAGWAPEQVDAAHLVLLAHGCATRERVRFDYVDRAGAATSRLVEPLRLVRAGARWYLVARDVDRRDWRTFRLDRLREPSPVGTPFEVVDPPDPVTMVAEGITLRSYPFRARIRIPLPVDQATRVVPRTFGVFEAEGETTIVELGAWSEERMTSYLAGVSPPCEVLEPASLREALSAHAAAVSAVNSSLS
ncbi:MAG: YafY family transcriptional regulator [Acidimicrobiaceae bacterium]|nr:YafY family transcriptional regulator [Acidimicrobiaceae bacterium]